MRNLCTILGTEKLNNISSVCLARDLGIIGLTILINLADINLG